MKKLAFISDIIFTFLIATLFSLCLFRFLGISFWISLALAVLCGTLTTLSMGAALAAKRKHAFLKKSDEMKKQKLFTHLAPLSDEEKTEYFKTALERSLKEKQVKRFGKLRLCTDSDFYFLHFKFSPVTADEISSFSRLKTGKKHKILFCSNIEENAKSLCASLDISVVTDNELYLALKAENLIPEKFLGENVSDKKIRRTLKLWFSKANARRFLTSGALILFVSWLTPFSYYYLIMSAILLLLALFTKIFGYTPKKI